MNKQHNLPDKLYLYVPKECLESAVRPGGWDPAEQVVPAFDPEVQDPKIVKNAFGFEDERVLVEVAEPKYKETFYQRKTGPDKGYHGIYASKHGCPGNFFKPVFN